MSDRKKPVASRTDKAKAKPNEMRLQIAVSSVSPSGWPDCPLHLKNSGRNLWGKGSAMWARGEIAVCDLEAWQMLCESFDELEHCRSVLDRHGEYQESSQGGYQEHPALRRIRAVEGKILRYQKLFGLVPDARKKRPVAQQGVANRKR